MCKQVYVHNKEKSSTAYYNFLSSPPCRFSLCVSAEVPSRALSAIFLTSGGEAAPKWAHSKITASTCMYIYIYTIHACMHMQHRFAFDVRSIGNSYMQTDSKSTKCSLSMTIKPRNSQAIGRIAFSCCVIPYLCLSSWSCLLVLAKRLQHFSGLGPG